MRGAILCVGILATSMALTVKSIYGLWYLSSDLVYVMLFPQLVCVVYFKQFCNTYGSLTAYIIGFLLRSLGGEEIVGLPALIKYPYYDEEKAEQLFPFRTLSMLVSLTTLLGVSSTSKWLFESGRIPPQLDIFHCVVNIPEDILKVQEPQEGEMSVLNANLTKTYQSEMNGRINPALNLSSDEAESDTPVTGTPKPPPYSAGNAPPSQNTTNFWDARRLWTAVYLAHLSGSLRH